MIEERANLAGRVAVIVGGGGGIGGGVTRALAQAGVDVAFCDIDEAAMAETEAAVSALGRGALSHAADATASDQLARFYAAVAARFERLDICVNVVGGVDRRDFMAGTAAQNAADIQRNYGYVIESVGHAVPLIRRGGRGGSIVNFTTIEAHRGAATFAVYAGAKAATTNFTRAVAVELAAEHIRCNCIAPDVTPSAGNWNALRPEDKARIEALPPELGGSGVRFYVPMKEQPPVEALADAVLFLGSDMARYITGTTLHVDGGTFAAAGFLDWPNGDGYVPAPLGGTTAKLFADDGGAVPASRPAGSIF